MNETRRNFFIFAATATGALMASAIPGASAARAGKQGGAMKLDSAVVTHFSPTGTSARAAMHLGKALAGSVTEVDLSAKTLEKYSINGKSAAVVAVPVYMGRVPARAVEALKLMSGNGTACVSLVLYGNRAFEDALVELNDILTEQGFNVVASGAFIGQHAIVPDIAAGRPDAKDLEDLNGFAAGILKILAAGKPATAPAVPGNRPYKEIPPAQPITPLVTDDCTECGLCASCCPLSAIPDDDVHSTDPGRCILCMRCVRDCPVGARVLPPPYEEKVTGYLSQFKARQDPKTYL